VKSSGFPALDENAKVAVSKTAFSRKIPQRLDVVLPVEYRLE
jgi:TonB family protein